MATTTWFAKAPSAPQIAIREYTLDEGPQNGDRKLPTQALGMTPADGTSGVKVAFDFENNGDEPLSAFAFKNAATGDSTGTVGDVKWLEPVKEGAKSAGDTVTVAGKQYVARPASDIKALDLGEKALLVGTPTGVKAVTTHADRADVTATGSYSETKVSATDPWHAKLAAPVVTPPAKAGAVTGAQVDGQGDRSGLLGSAALLLLAAVIAAWVVRRPTRWSGQ